MDYSFPAHVKVADFDGDGFADRIYAADMGGQVWRFDVSNGQPASSLIAGGVIAQLGGAPNASPALTDVRRFYYAPDVAVVNTRTENFTHIGIGSGHREHPLSTANQDRFYALRDYNVGPLTQAQYDALTIITDGSLVPVTTVNTTVPHGSAGWRLDLNIGGWNGEKVLAEARTFNNEVIFSTFMPSSGGNSCEPQLGMNRIYQMSIFNGSPVTEPRRLERPHDADDVGSVRSERGRHSARRPDVVPRPGHEPRRYSGFRAGFGRRRYSGLEGHRQERQRHPGRPGRRRRRRHSERPGFGQERQRHSRTTRKATRPRSASV